MIEHVFFPSPLSKRRQRRKKSIFQALFKNGAKHNNAMRCCAARRKEKTWNDKILENWIQQKTRFLLRCPYFFIISLHWTLFFCHCASRFRARLLAKRFLRNLILWTSPSEISMHASYKDPEMCNLCESPLSVQRNINFSLKETVICTLMNIDDLPTRYRQKVAIINTTRPSTICGRSWASASHSYDRPS